MSEIPFIQFYPGDYFQKTHGLTHSNHATYLLMLFAAWGSGGTLPNDDKVIASITKLSKRQWLAEKDVIMQYWTVDGDTICNKRMQKDYTEATEKRQRRVKAGSLGGIAKSLNSLEQTPSNATAMLRPNSSNALASQNQNQSHKEGKKERETRATMADDYVDAKKRIGLGDFPNKKHLDYIEGLRADFEVSTDATTIVEQFTANKVKNGTMVVGLAGDLRLWILRQRDIEQRKPAANGADPQPEWAVKRDENQIKVKAAMQKMREEEENGHAN